jgi:Trk-type K+ transport system membrane component
VGKKQKKTSEASPSPSSQGPTPGAEISYASPATRAIDAKRWDLNSIMTWSLCAFLLALPVADGILRGVGKAYTAGSELTPDRSRFAVMNAMTLTGFQGRASLANYPVAGQALILVLQLGGILFSLILGGLCCTRILRLPYSDGQVVRSACLTTAFCVFGGALVLLTHTEGAPMPALMLAASAFGNGGLAIGEVPEIRAWQTHLVLLPLAVIGSVGMPVLMEAPAAILRRQALSDHSRTVLRMTAWVYLVGFVLLLGVRLPAEQWPKETGAWMRDRVAAASVQSVNSRTAGLPFEAFEGVTRVVPWLLIPLMMIGGSPASTAGGVKTTTLVTLWRAGRRTIAGQPIQRSAGVALAWVGTYLVLMVLFCTLLLIAEPQLRPERVLFDTVSALSNVGLSYDNIMSVSPGLDLYTAAMFFGRVTPLLVLWWMARMTDPAELAVG